MVSKIERAKQFLPFDALKGLREALKEKEIEYVDKIELVGEKCEELEKNLKLVEKGNIVKVTFYKNRQYKSIEGTVTKIDSVMKKLIINEVTINFVDILKIDIC